jgi:site-specific DNA-methyltransferase (adenine-specific)
MIEPNNVYCMGALELLKALPDNSVDMVMVDPPYGHNNNNNGDLISRRELALGTSKTNQPMRPIANDGIEADELLKSVLPDIKRVLVPGGVLCCCCGGGGGPDPQFARWSLWIDAVLEYKQMVIWDKGAMGMGWHYRRSYETILVAQKGGAACKWYDTSHRVENIIRPGMNAPKIIPSMAHHPTEKPVGLFEFFIRLHTRSGELVLDCFAGSGASLVAARNLGRQYIGCDLSPEYVEMARKRLAQPYTMALFPNTSVEQPEQMRLLEQDNARLD